MMVLDEENIKKARITQLLICLNIIAFISVYLFSENDELFYFFAQFNRKVIEQYEVWRIFTSIFLHQTWFHLISNMIILYLYGSLIEKNYKTYEYILIYVTSGLIGNLFSLILFPLDTISVGASGAIFGLIGSALVLAMKSSDLVVLIIGLLYLIYFLVVGFQPGINVWAHVFGLLGGIFISYSINKINNRIKTDEIDPSEEEKLKP